MEMGLFGPNQTNSNSCASGAVAIGEAFKLIRQGAATIMLAGGVECPLAPLVFGAFDLIRAISSNSNDDPEMASRPFDARRDGFVMAEGSAVLVLEEYEHARRRGAEPYAEVLGYATTTDAFHMTAPRPDAAQSKRAMKEALADACLDPSRIDHINAHASATPLNDKTETLAIKEVFGAHAREIPVSATKSMHGHALGASGAIELAIGCLSFRHDYVPPVASLRNADPECDLDVVAGDGRSLRISAMLSNSFGFGGINAALVLARV
jgi:3-oxoacyl-[acyl-carrier-protein] synthase II